MDYLMLVVLVVPALIGLVAALALGPNRGSILGAGIMLVAVFVPAAVPGDTAGSRLAARLGIRSHAFRMVQMGTVLPRWSGGRIADLSRSSPRTATVGKALTYDDVRVASLLRGE